MLPILLATPFNQKKRQTPERGQLIAGLANSAFAFVVGVE
jgi:hypothetical protein